MVLMCEYSRASLPQIGRFLDRDHTTVIHARNLIPDLLQRRDQDELRLWEQGAVTDLMNKNPPTEPSYNRTTPERASFLWAAPSWFHFESLPWGQKF